MDVKRYHDCWLNTTITIKLYCYCVITVLGSYVCMYIRSYMHFKVILSIRTYFMPSL